MKELERQTDMENDIDKLCAEVDENLAWFKEHFPEV